MNVQLPLGIEKPAFLDWVQRHEGRYELAEGRVVMMTGVSRNHAIMVANLQSLLRAQLSPREWTVVADFGLDTGPKSLRYPDIVVDRKGGRGRDFTARAPALLIEVLSPSTATYDLGDKASEYLRLTSLSAYVVFAQEERKAWVWVRGDSGFPSGPDVIEGEDALVRIPSFAILLRFSEVYADLEET
jgi:Uma2 family endonuclease